MLSSYEVTGILGRGGMGAVYKGIQRNLDRPVAIKVLPETFSKGGDELNFVARFKQEARAMAKMAHPAIISVYDFGETENGQLYFVMEFIDGMDIHQYAKAHGGKLPQEHALNIVAHVLDALEYAHHMGIVHRDIKPANILINREGRVKIADFGLAKKFGSGADQSQPALTMSNVAVGTPDFVAPESLEAGRVVDHRADLYAVGVMLYQLLTGRLPRGQFKPPSEAVPGLDPRLDAIVSRAMQTEPEDRYPNAAAVRADLDVIFSRPMARVEAGAETEDIPVAVPVTTSVKEGAKPAGTAVKAVTGRKPGPGNTRSVRPSVPVGKEMARPNRLPLFLGLGAVALLVVGLSSYWMYGGGRPQKIWSKAEVPMQASSMPELPGNPPLPKTSPEAPKVEKPAKNSPLSVLAKTSPPTIPPNAASDEKFPPGQWVKILPPGSALPPEAQWKDGWIVAKGSELPILLRVPNRSFTQVGFKAVLQKNEDGTGNGRLGLRHHDKEGNDLFRATQISDIFSGKLWLSIQTHSKGSYVSQPLKTATAEFSGETPRLLEFAAVGERLILRIDGKLLASAEDAKPQAGDVLLTQFRGRIRDIEVINLDGLPEAEALKLAGIDAQGNDLRTATSALPSITNQSSFPPGQWVKVFTQFEELPDDLRNSNSGVKFDDGWIRFTPGQPKRIPIFNANANCGVRARVQRLTDKPQNRTTLVLRSDGTEISPFYRLYCANQLLVATKQSRDDTSYLFQAPIDDLPNGVGEYTMEFAVVGSNLIGRFGSQIPRVARGADLTGGISFITGEEAVRDIEVINLDGLPEAEALKILGIDEEGKNLRAPASSPPSITKEAPFPPGQWVKVFTKFEDLPTSLQAPEKGVKIEDGWIHLGNVASNWLYLPNELPSNCSVRATYRGGDPNDGSIIVRAQQTGQRYQVRLQAGKLLLQARDNDVFRTLAQADSTIAIEPASDSFTLELAAIGNKLVARMGSQMVQATIDPSHASGKNYLLGSQPLRDIEVMNLQGLPEAEALRLIGIDAQGNDLRAIAAKEEAQQMEQTKAAEALAAVPELKALDDQFQKLTVERVTTPFEKGLANLNTNYLGGLDRAIADAKKAGSLDTVLALEQEKNRIASGGSVPPEDEPTAPESLKKLRVIYREALAKLETERTANLKALIDPLIVRLKQLEIDLTKQDRVAHAKTAREYRERLEAPPGSNETSATIVTPPTPTPSPSSPTAPKSASNRVRPDPKVSRQAAEYALNLGASVTISANGAQLSILPGEDLPKGDFELYRVSFPTDKGLSITDADLQAITEARELRHFATGDRNNTTITSLAPFQKTPLIENISCYQYLTITEEDCSLLASLPQLKAAHFLGGAAPVANLPLLLSAPSLQDVSFSSISLRPEDGEVLNHFPKLRRLVISSKTMDALLLKMGDMDGLVALNMPYATVSAAGFSALNPKLSETLEELAFGQTVDDSTAGLNTAIERFPSLKILSCRGSVSPEVTTRISSLKQIEKLTFYQASMSSETFLAIGQCRGLVELAIGRGTLAAPDLEALRRLRNLKKLSIRDNGIQIDPGAIPQFGKLDTLTTLELPESQVTEEQVKELKKALPKCAISRVGAYQ